MKYTFFLWDEERRKKLPKNVTTGLCPECKTIGRIFIIGQVGQERAKCSSCNQEFDL
jgi:hypothetical protein